MDKQEASDSLPKAMKSMLQSAHAAPLIAYAVRLQTRYEQLDGA